MTETKLASTGIKELDAILRSLWIGDNVVWEIESGTYMDLFADHLAASAQKEKIPFVYISFNRSPATMSRRLSKFTRNSNFLLLDCFTSGKGRNDATFARFYSQPEKNRPGVELVKNPSDPAAFLKTLNKIEEAKGPKTRYVFDSLTGIQDLWGDEEKVYKLFTHSCPRLYDMDTIAYWILEKDVHSPAFKANLKHITQVALELISTDNSLYLKANKVEGRFARTL